MLSLNEVFQSRRAVSGTSSKFPIANIAVTVLTSIQAELMPISCTPSVTTPRPNTYIATTRGKIAILLAIN